MDNPEKWTEMLVDRYGPLIGGRDLRELLGFRTAAAMQRAIRQHLLKAPVFHIQGRRGLFAITTEVAGWLLQERARATHPTEPKNKGDIER